MSEDPSAVAEPVTDPPTTTPTEASAETSTPPPEGPRTVEDFMRDRDVALSSLDLVWARKTWPDKTDDDLLVCLHQARYEIPSIAAFLRHQSRAWLEEKGEKRVGDEPWPPAGQLPVPPPPTPPKMVGGNPYGQEEKLPAAMIMCRDFARRFVETSIDEPARLLECREEARRLLEEWKRGPVCPKCRGVGGEVKKKDGPDDRPTDEEVRSPSRHQRHAPMPKRELIECDVCQGKGRVRRNVNTRDEDRVTGQIIGARARALATGIIEGMFPKMPERDPSMPTPGETPAPPAESGAIGEPETQPANETPPIES